VTIRPSWSNPFSTFLRAQKSTPVCRILKIISGLALSQQELLKSGVISARRDDVVDVENFGGVVGVQECQKPLNRKFLELFAVTAPPNHPQTSTHLGHTIPRSLPRVFTN
jgi:hypothetical protein